MLILFSAITPFLWRYIFSSPLRQTYAVWSGTMLEVFSWCTNRFYGRRTTSFVVYSYCAFFAVSWFFNQTMKLRLISSFLTIILLRCLGESTFRRSYDIFVVILGFFVQKWCVNISNLPTKIIFTAKNTLSRI